MSPSLRVFLSSSFRVFLSPSFPIYLSSSFRVFLSASLFNQVERAFMDTLWGNRGAAGRGQ